MYLNMWGDPNVYAKFRIWECGKYTNFRMAMNVVLLAVCSPIFTAMCPKFSSCLELWFVCWEELRMRAKAFKLRVRNRERERGSFWKHGIYIRNHVTWLAPNTRFIFVQDKFKMCRHIVIENTGTWLLCPYQVPKTISFIFSPNYFCFENKWVLDFIFLKISTPCVPPWHV